MVKYNHTIEETVKALEVFANLWNVLYNLYNDVPENISVDADNELRYSVDDESFSFLVDLLTVFDPVYAIKEYLVEKERLRKEAEALKQQEVLAKLAADKEQKEYETYLKLKEKYEKLS